MNLDVMLLRAMLRLARRREAATEEALALRVGGSAGAVRATIRRLAACGLLERAGQCPRLTMAGLALAVALLPPRARRRTAAVVRASRAA